MLQKAFTKPAITIGKSIAARGSAGAPSDISWGIQTPWQVNFSSAQPPPQQQPPPWIAPGAAPPGESLAKYGLDLTEEARLGRLDPVIGRDEEVWCHLIGAMQWKTTSCFSNAKIIADVKRKIRITHSHNTFVAFFAGFSCFCALLLTARTYG